jgi:hypothetical protein
VRDLPGSAPKQPETLTLHALDRPVDKKTRGELEKFSKWAKQAQALCVAIPRISRCP